MGKVLSFINAISGIFHFRLALLFTRFEYFWDLTFWFGTHLTFHGEKLVFLPFIDVSSFSPVH